MQHTSFRAGLAALAAFVTVLTLPAATMADTANHYCTSGSCSFGVDIFTLGTSLWVHAYCGKQGSATNGHDIVCKTPSILVACHKKSPNECECNPEQQNETYKVNIKYKC